MYDYLGDLYFPTIGQRVDQVSMHAKAVIHCQNVSDSTDIYGMFILHTVPAPTLPSKVKKLAMGGSRPAKALRMSCARNPPMIAQTGENSCIAVVEMDLEKSMRE